MLATSSPDDHHACAARTVVGVCLSAGQHLTSRMSNCAINPTCIILNGIESLGCWDRVLQV